MVLITDITTTAQALSIEANRSNMHSFILNARKVTGEETDEDYLVGILSRTRGCDENAILNEITEILNRIKGYSHANLHDKECNYKAVMWLEGLAADRSISYSFVSKSGGILYKRKYLVEYPYSHVPVKVLDVTADQKVIESILQKPIKSIMANIDWQAKSTHIKFSVNRQRLNKANESDLKSIADYSLANIKGKKVLLVSYKAVIAKLLNAFETSAKKVKKTIEFQSYYFHEPRGINTFENCDSVIVVGLSYQNINSGWHDAHILFPADEDEKYRNTWNKKCIMEELDQLIHRIRPVRKEHSEIVLVSLLWPSNLPTQYKLDDHSHDENRVGNAFERLKPIVGELGFFNQDIGFMAGVYMKEKEKIIRALRCLVWVSLGDAVPQAPWDLSLTCQFRRVKIGRKAA